MRVSNTVVLRTLGTVKSRNDYDPEAFGSAIATLLNDQPSLPFSRKSKNEELSILRNRSYAPRLFARTFAGCALIAEWAGYGWVSFQMCVCAAYILFLVSSAVEGYYYARPVHDKVDKTGKMIDNWKKSSVWPFGFLFCVTPYIVMGYPLTSVLLREKNDITDALVIKDIFNINTWKWLCGAYMLQLIMYSFAYYCHRTSMGSGSDENRERTAWFQVTLFSNACVIATLGAIAAKMEGKLEQITWHQAILPVILGCLISMRPPRSTKGVFTTTSKVRWNLISLIEIAILLFAVYVLTEEGGSEYSLILQIAIFAHCVFCGVCVYLSRNDTVPVSKDTLQDIPVLRLFGCFCKRSAEDPVSYYLAGWLRSSRSQEEYEKLVGKATKKSS